MILDFIAAIAAGFGLLTVTYIVNHLTGRRLGPWIWPATVALGMVGYTVWAEYTWASRTISALPQLRLASSNQERVFYRPWTFVVPHVSRMIAIDETRTLIHPDQPDLVLTSVVLLGRWEPVRGVAVVFNCADNTRADLVEGAELADDGSVVGATWVSVPPDDGTLVAACTLAEEMRNA